MTNDILDEIRATRDAFAKAHNYDIHAMVETLRRLDEADPRPTVHLKPRPPIDVQLDFSPPEETLDLNPQPLTPKP